MSIIVAAPASGSGKTTITLGILRALSRRGLAVRGAKSGPDYIDPQFHAAACGRTCFNLDAWAMTQAQVLSLANHPECQIIEGAMGLFDGAPPSGKGATADLARILGLPVIFVVDASSLSQSVVPLVKGFANHDPHVRIAGVILNKVGSDRHEKILRQALAQAGISVFGAVHRSQSIMRPSRHLGLVQAGEMPDLEAFLNKAADIMEQTVDLNSLYDLATRNPIKENRTSYLIGDLKSYRIAIAQDAAFSFRYAHQDAELQQGGATLLSFSPLNNDAVPEADKVILPGGYPELHAARISQNHTFLTSLREMAKFVPVYGECGGYMVLGEVLTDAQGNEHRMAGLLPLHTSFETRKLHLGYRRLTRKTDGKILKGHEFHYATTVRSDGTPLYDAQDAQGNQLGPSGLIEEKVSGSFAHIIP